MSSELMETKNLVRRFKSGDEHIEVLRGVDICINEGDTVSIQGESGCGKSTLLNLMAGLDQADEGGIFWNSEEISRHSNQVLAIKRSSLIGMVFQSYYLVPEIRALENVMLGGRISGNTDNLAERSKSLLQRVGLGSRMSSLPSTLSGGERQRVAIARAMISDPKVLLADEPTGNLDEATGDSIMDMLQELCEEKQVSLILVTHSANYAARMCRSWVLRKGILEKNNGQMID